MSSLCAYLFIYIQYNIYSCTQALIRRQQVWLPWVTKLTAHGQNIVFAHCWCKFTSSWLKCCLKSTPCDCQLELRFVSHRSNFCLFLGKLNPCFSSMPAPRKKQFVLYLLSHFVVNRIYSLNLPKYYFILCFARWKMDGIQTINSLYLPRTLL